MLHINYSVKINHFNLENELEFYSFIHSNKVVKEFHTLSNQRFKNGKNIYLLIQNNNSFLNKYINYKRRKIIGYCIVEDIRELPLDIKGFANIIYNIPHEVLNKYPIVISDFMIEKNCRKKGFGKSFAKHIILDLYKSENISLKADGEGAFFWPKLGFFKTERKKDIMVLNREEYF